MRGSLYFPIFLYGSILLTILAGISIAKSYKDIKIGSNNFLFTLILTTVIALWIGDRPPIGYFVDTTNYAHRFYRKLNGATDFDNHKEYLWEWLMDWCVEHADLTIFFTIVSVGYFGFTLWACKKLIPNNVLTAFVFFMGSLSFYSYSTNGIRNGLACSIALTSMAFMNKKQSSQIIAGALGVLALGFHKSTIIPLGAMFASWYFVKSFKWAYSFWLFSILLSIMFGNSIGALLESLGFDDRAAYITSEDDGIYTNRGFRWDFLLYSMMPIILGYYIVIRKGIQDRTYTMLLNTYTLSNAFWVMVIRANYSNRFAYLSWFMYPLVLAYPLFELDIWGKDQGRHLKQIMWAQMGFTWFMYTIFW